MNSRAMKNHHPQRNRENSLFLGKWVGRRTEQNLLIHKSNTVVQITDLNGRKIRSKRDLSINTYRSEASPPVAMYDHGRGLRCEKAKRIK